MRITTWNINSVRLRLPLVKQFLAEYQPDVLCLQETKCMDDAFPLAEFASVGYKHTHIRGEKSYNGVAIISRLPLHHHQHKLWAEKNDTRHVSAQLENGLEIHNFYVPAGGEVPDTASNPKFKHKLDFIDEMAQWFKQNRNNSTPMILVGDLNIAPTQFDVWSHTQLLKVVSYTPIEREKLELAQNNFGWIDAVRSMHPEQQQLYSWWSYRNSDWQKSNRGRRLDHIWITPPLKQALDNCSIIEKLRSVEKPSDHVPVSVDINMG